MNQVETAVMRGGREPADRVNGETERRQAAAEEHEERK